MEKNIYQAGATRLVLELQGEITDKNVYYRKNISKSSEKNKVILKISSSETIETSEEKVVWGIFTGYRFSSIGSIKPLFWEVSVSACESGVLCILPIGAYIEKKSYKERKPSTFYKATEEGLLKCDNPELYFESI